MIHALERNRVLDHKWGVSAGADRVWAQIAGRAPSAEPWKRIFMVLQAFVDESYDADVFALAGYIASAEAWGAFSGEWEKLLPFAKRGGKKGNRRFKMSEMVNDLDYVRAFYRVIETNVAMSISCCISLRDLESARNRIWVEGVNIDWDHYHDPYKVSFYALLDSFHKWR